MFLGCRAVLPHMIKAGSGRSSASRRLEQSIHRAPRADLIRTSWRRRAPVALSRLIAGKYGPHGFRSNVIAPGMINSWGTPELEAAAERSSALGRIGTVEEVAAVGLFLASEQSSYVTGQENLPKRRRTCFWRPAGVGTAAADGGSRHPRSMFGTLSATTCNARSRTSE